MARINRTVTVARFAAIGYDLTLSSIKSSYITTDRRFQSHFDVTPEVCYKVWMLCEEIILEEISQKHHLWALCSLETYRNKDIHRYFWRAAERKCANQSGSLCIYSPSSWW